MIWALKQIFLTQEVTLSVIGMKCNKCVKKIEDNVADVYGVKDIKVNLNEKTAVVEFDPAKVDGTSITQRIISLGFEAKDLSNFQGKYKQASSYIITLGVFTVQWS